MSRFNGRPDLRSHRLYHVLARYDRWIVMLAVLGVATVLRAYHLENQSLWEDEIYSWWASHFARLGEVVRYGVLPDLHPPGYQVLMFFVQRLLGDSEYALRLPSALAGVLAVALIYALGRCLYGRDEGRIAAALTAVLWFPVHYSQEARSYAFLMVGALGTTLLWLRICRRIEQDRPLWRTPLPYTYGALVVLTAYLHYFGLYLIAWQALGGVARLGPRRLGRLLPAYGLCAGLYLPWVGPMVRQLLHSSRSTWFEPVSAIHTTLYDFAEHVFNQRAPQTYTMLGLVLLALILDLGRRRSRPPAAAATAQLLLWFLLPFAGVYLFSRWVKPILTYRNLIIVAPALYLLAARGLTQLPGRGLTTIAAAIAVGVFAYQIGHGGYYVLPRKTQFREAAVWMQAREEALNDGTVIGQFAYPFLLDYGFRTHPRRHPVALLVEDDRVCTGAASHQPLPGAPLPVCPTVSGDFSTVLAEDHPMTEAEVIRSTQAFAQAQPTRYLWYVTALGEPLMPPEQWGDVGFVEEERQYFFGIHVYLYRRDP